MERADVGDAPIEKDEEWLEGLDAQGGGNSPFLSAERALGMFYFEWKEPVDQERLKIRREQVYIMK